MSKHYEKLSKKPDLLQSIRFFALFWILVKNDKSILSFLRSEVQTKLSLEQTF
jgi:hypothetical protein